MISNLSWTLIFLSVCGIVSSLPDRAIDCRKFVFAPLCRGVAAKRDSPELENYETAALFKEESFRNLLRNLYSTLAFSGEREENIPTGTSIRHNDIENLARAYQRRINPVLKLFESRSNSARDYSQEFENL